MLHMYNEVICNKSAEKGELFRYVRENITSKDFHSPSQGEWKGTFKATTTSGANHKQCLK